MVTPLDRSQLDPGSRSLQRLFAESLLDAHQGEGKRVRYLVLKKRKDSERERATRALRDAGLDSHSCVWVAPSMEGWPEEAYWLAVDRKWSRVTRALQEAGIQWREVSRPGAGA